DPVYAACIGARAAAAGAWRSCTTAASIAAATSTISTKPPKPLGHYATGCTRTTTVTVPRPTNNQTHRPERGTTPERKHPMNLPKTAIRAFIAITLALAATVALATPAAALTRWNRDTVTIENRLDSSWPVETAIGPWHRASGLDIVVVDKCPVMKTSRVVLGYGRRPQGPLGKVEKAYDARRRCKSAKAAISDRILPEFDYLRRRCLISHEVGHVLGFAHDPANTRSVMYPHIVPGCQSLPSYTHTESLRELYGYAS